MKNSEVSDQPHILIIDDDRAAVDSLRRLLRRAGFTDVTSTVDPREALQLCLWRAPDLVLLDLQMPFLRGEQVLARLRAELPSDVVLPVIVLTGDPTEQAKETVFQTGAQDFIRKPYGEVDVILRIRNQLAMSRAHRALLNHNQVLERLVDERTQDLRHAQLELLERLAHAAEYRDDDTGEHARRVGRLSARIAAELGFDSETVELIWRAAMLHDVGKIGISDTILMKPGKLTDEEMEEMRTHVVIGAEILAGGSSSYLKVAERIARSHHEWWNGRGYLGLSRDEIPIEGRIVAVADVFDALTHERPYKEAWSVDRAIKHIVSCSGSHFDPAVVNALLRVIEDRPELATDPLMYSAPPAA